MKEVLNIVDKDDKIIGEKSREEIHRDGLYHREVHVYFILPDGKIIFQHRAKDKDTYPNLLDATVGGHVEIDHSYEETAIKEAKEETGIDIKAEDLIFIDKIFKSSNDKVTNTINSVFRCDYLYKYDGSVEDLVVEEGKSQGFVVFSIDDLLNMGEVEKNKFIKSIFEYATNNLRAFLKST